MRRKPALWLGPRSVGNQGDGFLAYRDGCNILLFFSRSFGRKSWLQKLTQANSFEHRSAVMRTAWILPALLLALLLGAPALTHQPAGPRGTASGDAALPDTADWTGTWKMVKAEDLRPGSGSMENMADRVEGFYVFTKDRVRSIASAKIGSTCTGGDMEILGVEEGVIRVLNEADSKAGIRVQSISRDTMTVVVGGLKSVTGNDPKGIRKVLVRSGSEPQEALGCKKVEGL